MVTIDIQINKYVIYIIYIYTDSIFYGNAIGLLVLSIRMCAMYLLYTWMDGWMDGWVCGWVGGWIEHYRCIVKVDA